MKVVRNKIGITQYFCWIWLILTTALLTTDGKKLPNTELDTIPHFDKFVHVVLFGVLSWLFVKGYTTAKNKSSSSKTNLGIITLVLTLYGIAMEYVQLYWVPFRSFDLDDIVADTVGVVLGAAIATKWGAAKKVHNFKSPSSSTP